MSNDHAKEREEINTLLKQADALIKAAEAIADKHALKFTYGFNGRWADYYGRGYEIDPSDECERYAEEAYGSLEGWISSSAYC